MAKERRSFCDLSKTAVLEWPLFGYLNETWALRTRRADCGLFQLLCFRTKRNEVWGLGGNAVGCSPASVPWEVPAPGC